MDMAAAAEKAEDKEKWQGFVELLTPLCKAYSSDMAVKICYAATGAEESKGKQRSLIRKDADIAFYAGKVSVAKFFAVSVLLSIKARCGSIKVGDKTPLEIADESFTS